MDQRSPRILVVEDDPAVGPRVVAGLIRAGFDATLVADGDAAVPEALQGRYDAVVLDLMLPGRSGFSCLEAWAGRLGALVVVLSAQTELPSRLRAFEGGAIDFVPKPFFLEELVVRLRTRLAVPVERARRTVVIGDVKIDLDLRLASREGVDLGLTAHEFNILALMLEHPGKALTRVRIAELALPHGGQRLDRTVDSHVSRIRRKLGDAGGSVRTVFGVGYRFDPGGSA